MTVLKRTGRFSRRSGTAGVLMLGLLSGHVYGSGDAGEVSGEAATGYHMSLVGSASLLAPFASGDYERAIEQIEQSKGSARSAFARHNNLCVAYTKSGQFEAAMAHCDEAVEMSRQLILLTHNGKAERKHLAIALSNRGVFLAVSQDTMAATEDFIEARRVARGATPAKANLQILEENAAIAVADAAP